MFARRSGAGTLVETDEPVQAGDNEADSNKDIANKCEDAEKYTPQALVSIWLQN